MEMISPPALPDARQKILAEIFNEFAEKVMSNSGELAKSFAAPPQQEAKSFFVDPYQMINSVGLGYQQTPSQLTFQTLRRTSEKNSVLAAIILTRVNQVAAFARIQENKYSTGFLIRPRGRDKRRLLSESETRRKERLEFIIMNTGRDYNIARDSFEQYLRKVVRDRLTFDQMCTEKVPTNSGSVHHFLAVAADTIFTASPKITKDTPPDVARAKSQIKYAQVINGKIEAQYTIHEMAFGVANPRSGLDIHGYGFPEIEQLITTITSHLYAEEWNRRLFSQGSTVKGLLNIKGSMSFQAFEMFKRQWQAQVSGVNNAWKTPVTNQEEVQWIPLQMNNTEMGYQMWMEYLIKIASAIYQIDPAEINFDLRGSGQNAPVFMSNNEAQQKVSKDRGLSPLLRFIEDYINRHIVWPIDPEFEFAFAGLDAKTEEQATQLRQQQGASTLTLNEVRALEERPPVKEGDIVLNPTYTSWLMQKQQMEQQQAMMGSGSGAPQAGAAQGGGQPAQPGAAQGAPAPTSPFDQQFAGRKPGDEEKKAADNMNRFHNENARTSSPLRGQHASSSESADSSSARRSVHINDWASKSFKPDLRKAEDDDIDLYDTVEL